MASVERRERNNGVSWRAENAHSGQGSYFSRVTELLGGQPHFTALADRRAGGAATDMLVATGRLPHRRPAPSPDQPLPDPATPRQQMAHRLRSPSGRAAYARRKVIVEPVFGQLDTLQNGKRLLLRGQDLARGERRLLAGCHNLRKLFGQLGTAARLAPTLA